MPDKSDQTTLSLLPPDYAEGTPETGIPDKMYFRIGEACRLTGLSAHVLRFWESEFPQIRPKRTRAGQRLYTQADIRQILRIKTLLYEKKFTLKGARKYLRTGTGDKDALLREIAAELAAIRDLLG